MKKLSIIALALMMFMGVQAQASVINDSTNGVNTYWGAANSLTGMPTNQDIYGGGPFALDKMEVNISGGVMTVQVVGSYFTAWTAGKTSHMAPGDLFIDLDGWNPTGTAPHYGDDNYATHGLVWDLAFDLDTSALYDTSKTYAIAMTNNLWMGNPQGNPYRIEQEWDFSGGNWLTNGAWNITGNTLTMSFAIAGTGIGTASDLGMHWTMQCGNDVINGEVPVPEPTMMLLFGSGLVGLAFFARRK